MDEDPAARATPARILNRAATSMERVNAFSDGVFSIAITLLLFEVRAPAADALAGRSLAQALWDERVAFLTLALSFGLMGIYWVGHSAMFRLIQRADRNLLWANLLFLLFVGLIPFSASMLTSHVESASRADALTAITVYCSNLILAGLSLDLLWWHASRGKRLIDPSLHEHLVWMVHVRVLAGASVYLVAIAIAWTLGVGWTLLFLVVTPILYIFPFVFDRIEERHLRRHPHD